MIKSFKHKGLKEFFETGVTRGIDAAHADKLATRLDRLDASTCSEDMALPGYRLHPLKGRDKGMWAIDVSGAWRMTFKFEGEDAIVVDYKQYH